MRAVQPDAGWVSRLEPCGHSSPVPPLGLPPRPGQWISCRGCQCQRRVAAVDGPAVYVQETLL